MYLSKQILQILHHADIVDLIIGLSAGAFIIAIHLIVCMICLYVARTHCRPSRGRPVTTIAHTTTATATFTNITATSTVSRWWLGLFDKESNLYLQSDRE